MLLGLLSRMMQGAAQAVMPSEHFLFEKVTYLKIFLDIIMLLWLSFKALVLEIQCLLDEVILYLGIA